MDAELATPVDTQTCAVRLLLENAFLLKGKSNQTQHYQSNLFNPFTHRENALTNYRVYGYLSYKDSNHIGGSRGGLPPTPLFLD